MIDEVSQAITVRVRFNVCISLFMLWSLIVDCLDAVEERCMLGFSKNPLEWCVFEI